MLRIKDWQIGNCPTWFFAFILLLVLMPLPFGSNRPWASNLFAAISGFLVLAMLWREHGNLYIPKEAPIKRLSFSIVAVSIVIAWSFVQVSSWTPISWHHPMWAEAEKSLGPLNGAIAIDTGLFLESLLRFTGYVACFILAFFGCRNPDCAKKLIYSLTIAGVCYAAYGLIVQSMGSNTILWYSKWAYKDFLTSTFVNKNSYATYVGLGLLCAFAFLKDHFSKKEATDPVLAQRSKFASLLISLNTKDYLYLAGLLLMLAALALTGSRAGIVSSLFGLTTLFAGMAINKRFQMRKWLWVVLICLGTFVIFIGLGGNVLLTNLDPESIDSDTKTRLAAYTLAGRAIEDNLWLGYGLGSFDSAFRLYRDSSLKLWFHHAHNDYIEMIMDLGLPVAFLLFSSILAMTSCCFEAIWKRKRNFHYAGVALGASALVALHSTVDFGLHIPAIAATFAALLGMGVAQSWGTRSREKVG